MRSGTREKLLAAAADLIAAAPGEDFSLRAVCDQVGVKLPTLYHFFGSKSGLIEAVIERGFDLYMGEKEAQEHTGDPIQDIRHGWDAHVRFGITNPGFYTLMYGKIRPGYSPAAQSRPSEILLALTRRADEQGRLTVTPEQAAAHILATNVGITLRQIVMAEEDRELSIGVREGAIAAITGTHSPVESHRADLHRLMELVSANPNVLGAEETRLFSKWLRELTSDATARNDQSARPPRAP